MKKVYDEEKIRAIADKIRSKTGGDSTYKTSEMADGVEEVYEAGGKAEYDRFWDNYQDYGNRTNQRFLFAGHGWTKETMKPKYDIDIDDGYMMFAYNQVQDDLVELLKDTKIIYNYVSSLQYMFYNACFTRVGEIDTSGASIYGSNLYGTFSTARYLKTIDKLILRDDGQNSFHSTFDNCTSLENITIEGVIGNDFKISFSPLTHDSLMSIINALKNFVETKTLRYENADYMNNGFDADPKGAILTVTSATLDGSTLTCEAYKDDYGSGKIIINNIDISAEDVANIETIMLDVIEYDAETGFVVDAVITTKTAPTATKTLTLGSDNLAKLTDEEKAMATDKGWQLA